MRRIDPFDPLDSLGWLDIEIDDDGLLIASDDNAQQWLVGTSVDLLMRNERRNKYEITRARFSEVF